MRVVRLDSHRVFAEAVMLENGAIRRLGRIGMTRDHLTAFAKTLTHDDHVVVEATGSASAVAEVASRRGGARSAASCTGLQEPSAGGRSSPSACYRGRGRDDGPWSPMVLCAGHRRR